MKYFIITIDTEGDNLWAYKRGDVVTTENSIYIPRFQELCEKYDFKPVWLTNYEMACDERFVEYIRPKMQQGLCEVGIHVHAWNNPPYYELERKFDGNPYLIEYPYEIMREKFSVTYNLIGEMFGKAPVSHRAGRWTMDEKYFNLLREFNIKVDCSYTPNVTWEDLPGETLAGGSNYNTVSRNAHWVDGVLEVPMTIRVMRLTDNRTILHRFKDLIFGKTVWLRPSSSSLQELVRLCNKVSKEPNTDYLEFMIHSSELMPGGSPYFKSSSSVEKLYNTIEAMFKQLENLGFKGVTLEEYYRTKTQ